MPGGSGAGLLSAQPGNALRAAAGPAGAQPRSAAPAGRPQAGQPRGIRQQLGRAASARDRDNGPDLAARQRKPLSRPICGGAAGHWTHGPIFPAPEPRQPLSQPIPARPDPPRVTQGLSRKPWVKTTPAPGSKVVTDHYERAGLVPTWTSSGSAWSATAAARASGTPGICRPRSARRSARRTCPWYRCSGRCVRRPAGRSESAEEVRVRDRAAVRGRGLPGAVRLDPPHPRVRARR